MQGANPVIQSFEGRRRWSFWIAGIVALAAVAALTACASQGPAPPGLTPTPVPGGEKTVITHNVTIKAAGGTCTVDPWELPNVGLPDVVRFSNQTASPIMINFDSLELFGVASITVPPNNTVGMQVGGRARPGAVYLYSVSCSPLAGEARPRIVIRSAPD